MRSTDHIDRFRADLSRLTAAARIGLAISGGPDSMALLHLAAEALPGRIEAATVDHGLRAEAVAEAALVARACATLDVPHATLRVEVAHQASVQAAARRARYVALAAWASERELAVIATAHHADDQAETLLMRLLRGSGISGLSAMAGESERDGVRLMRPLLEISKAELIATLEAAGIAFADDPTNRDTKFTRPRLRALMPALAEEGADARTLARLAARLARADAAVEVLADGAERFLVQTDRSAALGGYDARAFSALPEEIRLRLLKRAIDRHGHEGPAELGKVEALLAVLDRAITEQQPRLKQTLAGAAVSLSNGRILVQPAPPRRRRTA